MAQPYPPFTGMTPQDVASARKYGTGLMQQGTDASPVGHWTQALARVLQGGVGGYEVGSANKGEAQGRASGNALIAQALNGGNLQSSVGPMMANPWTADTGKDLSLAIIKHRMGHNPEESKAKIAAQLATAAANNAHAEYYRASAKALNSKATAQPQPQATTLDDAYGMTEEGEIILPSQQQAQPRGFSLPQGGNVPSLPPPASASGVVIQGQPQQRPPGMMRLGGPRDDIDASMRLDEGRPQPRGVQVAQAGEFSSVPPLLEQARNRAMRLKTGDRESSNVVDEAQWGPGGLRAGDVPGIVTNGKGASDPLATREAAGQRAFGGATPEQQDRYRKFRQEQQLWTSAFGSPPRAGYYYGPRGEELAKSDRVYKGDAENAGLMKHNMQVIDEASKILLNTSLPVQAVAGTIGYGETARALSDLEGAATQIAFTLSGKSVSNAERQEFMNRYAPKPMDSNYTINHKVGRMKQFYQALIDAKKSGVDDRAAWDMATKTTQTTPAPNNPAKGLSDDELLKELNK